MDRMSSRSDALAEAFADFADLADSVAICVGGGEARLAAALGFRPETRLCGPQGRGVTCDYECVEAAVAAARSSAVCADVLGGVAQRLDFRQKSLR